MKLFNVARERAAERTRRTNSAQQQRLRLQQRIGDAWQQRSDDAAALVAMHADLTALMRVQADLAMTEHRANAISAFSPFHSSATANTTATTDDRPCIIYCDPPWRYDNQSHANAAESHYPTMSDEQLAAMPVAGLAGEDCALLMWATFPKLDSALRVMAAWGFEYRTVFVIWVKLQRYMGRLRSGTGTYTQPNAELVLLGTRGRISAAASANAELLNNVVMSRKREHSRKPELLRQMAVEVFGDYPRIELFARGHVSHDWLAWGNEVAASRPVSEKKRKRGTLSCGTYSVLEHFGSHNCISTSSTVEPECGPRRRGGASSVASATSKESDADEEDDDFDDDDERLDGGVKLLDQFYSSTGDRRHVLYPQLTEAEVERNIDVIVARQQRNADELFVHNYAPAGAKVQWPRRPALD